MMRRGAVALVVVSCSVGGVAAAGGGGGNDWTSAGGNRENTRFQQSEHRLRVENVGNLTVKWAFTTGGDVSATPAVDESTVYVPDWAGNLWAIDKRSGQQRWRASIPMMMFSLTPARFS